MAILLHRTDQIDPYQYTSFLKIDLPDVSCNFDYPQYKIALLLLFRISLTEIPY
jgi:hypothetical protein